MALARWQTIVTDDAGNVIDTPSFEVRRDVDGAPLARIYSDRLGASPIANPGSGDADGYVYFHAEGGPYRIRVYKGAFEREYRYIGIGTFQEADQGVLNDPGYLFEYETETVAPPTEGFFRLNNADASLATAMYVSKITRGGFDVGTRLLELDPGANGRKNTLVIAGSSLTGASWLVDAAADSGDYVTITLSSHTGDSTLEVDTFSLQREMAGIDGADGSGLFSRVRAAATANVDLAAPGATIDDVAMAAGELFLAPEQTAPAETGPYTWNGAAVAATRATGFTTYNSMPGTYVSVMEGTANADTLWRCTSDQGGTLGVTALVFEEFSGGGTTSAATIAALKALDTTKHTVATVTDTGRDFIWDGSNLSATLTPSSVTSTAVNDTTETITQAAHGWETGYAVYPTTTVNGLTAETIYYVIKVDADSFKLASTFLNAKAGTAFNLTGTTNFTLKHFVDPLGILYAIPTGKAADGSEGAWTYKPASGLPIEDRWAGAAKDGVADDTHALQACIDLAFLIGGGFGGSVLVTRGRSDITYALQMRRHVALWGLGILRSRIIADDCNAVEWDFTTGFGNSVVQGISFEGITGTTRLGLYQPGTLNDADELYGITIRDCSVRGFNIGIKFRTVRDVTIDNCWLQDVNSGIHLVGKCLVVRIINNTKIVKAAGNGAGTETGIYCDSFNYTGGTGVIRPETVIIDGVTLYGHTRAVAFEQVIYGTITHCDIMGTGEAVRVNGSLACVLVDIDKNYIQANGASSSAAVRVIQQAAVVDSKINVTKNRIETVNGAASTTIGVLVATSGTGNADNVAIENNTFNGNTLYDIAVYGSGQINIKGNRCRSAVPATSISLSAIPAGRPVIVEGNNCAGAIAADAADVSAGEVIMGPNVSGATITMNRWGHVTNAGSPNTVVTAKYIGETCFDSTNGKWYKANAADNASWVLLN